MYTELVLLLEWDWVEVWVDIRDFKTQERGRREEKPEVIWHLRASVRMTKN